MFLSGDLAQASSSLTQTFPILNITYGPHKPAIVLVSLHTESWKTRIVEVPLRALQWKMLLVVVTLLQKPLVCLSDCLGFLFVCFGACVVACGCLNRRVMCPVESASPRVFENAMASVWPLVFAILLYSHNKARQINGTGCSHLPFDYFCVRP